MSSTPVGWKLFIIINYLLLFVFFFVFASLCVFLENDPVEKSDMITFIPFFTGSFLIMLNALFTIIHYHRHYPEKPFSRKTYLFFLFHTGFYLLSILALSFLVILGFIEETGSSSLDSTGLTLLVILCILLLICIYSFAFQIRLKKTLEKNYENSINQIIKRIGIPE